MNLAIVIPTYNEADNIEILINNIYLNINKLENLFTNIYVVDDASPDKTADIVEKISLSYCMSNFKINVLKRKKKEGLGAAYIDAFTRILSFDPPVDFILQMDADLSHNPSYIPLFIEKANSNHDFVVGSRYMNDGGAPDWVWYRKLLSRAGNLYAQIMLDERISDYTGGFNLYSRRILNEEMFHKINMKGYGFLISLKYFCALKSNNLSQIPIIFTERKMGSSKMPVKTFIVNFLLVIKIKISNWKG